jgi:hypothetical protein
LRGTPLRIQMNTAKNPYVDTDKGKKGKKRWFWDKLSVWGLIFTDSGQYRTSQAIQITDLKIFTVSTINKKARLPNYKIKKEQYE